MHFHHAFQAIATFHREKNCLLYEHLLHFVFEDVLCSSVWSTGCSRDAYTFEGGRVVNHTDTFAWVFLDCIAQVALQRLLLTDLPSLA